MKRSLTNLETATIGLTLFALFFGAGNMIFPPYLGQEAGTNVWKAYLGFLVTGVGLPLLGIIAIGRAGDLQTLAKRVSPIFGAVFTLILYMAIGPFFGIPRTGTVAYEMGLAPFLDENGTQRLSLIIFTIGFFVLTAWLSMNPAKLVDRIGKVLTPILIVIIGMLILKAIVTPMGEPQDPKGNYLDNPIFAGFLEGYLTMDTLAALVFGIVVISAINERGVTDRQAVARICLMAGVIAAVGLGLVYLSLAYIGASSIKAVGALTNGGAILSASANYLFGPIGTIILGAAISFACLTTAVGLISSVSKYLTKVSPKLSYKTSVIVLSVFSMIVANFGLTKLISISVPVLVALYPLAIVLISLSFFHDLFKGSSWVYKGALIPTGFISILDGLKAAGIEFSMITGPMHFLPFYLEGIGWVFPAIAGAIVGYVFASLKTDSR